MSLARQINNYLGSKFVLVLEPSQTYRTTLKNFLRNLRVKNFKVVKTVDEARREMASMKVGFFIVEWHLAEKNGLQFCRELRGENAYKSTPFLLLSTENLRHDIILASEGGIDGYLLKPFSFLEFSEQVKTLVNSAQNPSNLQSILGRADQHLDMGETWIAEALFFEAQSIKPNSARAMCGLVRIEIMNKDYNAAREKLRVAISFNAHYLEVYKLLLQIAEESGDTKALFEQANYLHEISPDNPRYPLVIADALLQAGDLAASEMFFKKTLSLSPKIAAAHRGLGLVYLKKHDYPRAQKCFQKALDFDHADISTLNSLALALVKLGKINEGIQKYKIALSINPKDARILYNLALAFEQKGDQKAVVEHLQKAIEVDPNFEKARKSLERWSNDSEENTKSEKETQCNAQEDTAPLKKGA